MCILWGGGGGAGRGVERESEEKGQWMLLILF